MLCIFSSLRIKLAKIRIESVQTATPKVRGSPINTTATKDSVRIDKKTGLEAKKEASGGRKDCYASNMSTNSPNLSITMTFLGFQWT